MQGLDSMQDPNHREVIVILTGNQTITKRKFSQPNFRKAAGNGRWGETQAGNCRAILLKAYYTCLKLKDIQQATIALMRLGQHSEARCVIWIGVMYVKSPSRPYYDLYIVTINEVKWLSSYKKLLIHM